jgi:hypothetical protein
VTKLISLGSSCDQRCDHVNIIGINFPVRTDHLIIHISIIHMQMGQFFYSAKAFDMLERLDPNPEYWEGKRGACIGHFQLIIAGREERQSLADIVQMLKNTSNPQVEAIVKVMKKWAKDNRVAV